MPVAVPRNSRPCRSAPLFFPGSRGPRTMASAPLRDTWPPTGCMAVRARLDGDKSLVSDRWERGRPVADALNKATTAIFNKHLVSLCIPRRDRLAHGPRWNDQPAPAETIRYKMRPLCPKRLRSGTVRAYPGHRSQYVVTRMPSRSARFETLGSAPPRWDRFPRESPPRRAYFERVCRGVRWPIRTGGLRCFDISIISRNISV